MKDAAQYVCADTMLGMLLNEWTTVCIVTYLNSYASDCCRHLPAECSGCSRLGVETYLLFVDYLHKF